MSSSDPDKRGTAFISPNHEMSLERLYANTKGWNRQTEEDYMERVKARATDRVKGLLLETRTRCDDMVAAAHKEVENIHAEAEALRKEAQRQMVEALALQAEAKARHDHAKEEGMEAGKVEARVALGETTAIVLLGIHEQCAGIFEAWRQDMTALLHAAVEKGIGLMLDTERKAILDSLLDQSIHALLDRTGYTIKVHPSDVALVTEIMGNARQASHRMAAWEVMGDPTMEAGSLVVENSSAFINNSREARKSVVDEVLEHLTIPTSEADRVAFSNQTETLLTQLKANGIQLDGEEEDAPVEAAVVEAVVTSPAAPAAMVNEASGEAEPVSQSLIPPGEEGLAPPAAATATPEAPQEGTGEELVLPEPEDIIAEVPLPAPSMDDELLQAVEAAFDRGLEAPEASHPPMEEDISSTEQAQDEADSLVDVFLSDVGVESSLEEGENPALPSDLADELLADMGFASPENRKSRSR